MKKFIILPASFLLLFCFFDISFAQKRDSFAYKDKPASHQEKEEWFGKAGTNRKKIETQRAKKEKEAREKEAARQKALQAAREAEQKKDKKTKPNIEIISMDEDKKNLKSALNTGSINAEVQQGKTELYQRAGEYPGAKTRRPKNHK